MNYNKTYFEIYAALVLCDIGFIDSKFNVDMIVDKPDIQFEDIGIEVTRDIHSDDAQQISYWNKTAGKTPEDKIKKLSCIDKKKVSNIWREENKNVLSFPARDENILIETIKNKSVKVINYSKFENINLFIFSDVFMLDVDGETLLPRILKNIEHNFNIIFILSHKTLFKWENMKLTLYTFESGTISGFKERSNKINKTYFDIHGNRK